MICAIATNLKISQNKYCMLLFLLVLVIAVFITKQLWSKTATIVVSIINGILALVTIPSMMQDPNSGLFNIGSILAVAYAVCFVGINLVLIIGLAIANDGLIQKLKDLDYSNDDYDDEDYDDNDEDDEETEYGKYIIQYRNGYGGWIDGPGSNEERTAERMFDNFISKEMLRRNATRARLVKVGRHGKIISILGTS